MTRHAHVRPALAALALAAAAFPLSAQVERESPVAVYDLMQVAVSTGVLSPEDFSERMQAIRSCPQAADLGEEFGGDVRRNRNVRASALPGDIEEMVAALSVGEASEVFGVESGVMRVLVLCGRV